MTGLVRLMVYRNGVTDVIDCRFDEVKTNATKIVAGWLDPLPLRSFVMAAFDATLSGANATSYVSLERARDILVDTPQQALWDSMSDPEKRSALNAATFWMETLTYYGSRCGIPSVDDPTKPQALQWPRSGVTCNGYTAACDLIPYKIEYAQVLIALQLHQNPNAILPPGGGGWWW